MYFAKCIYKTLQFRITGIKELIMRLFFAIFVLILVGQSTFADTLQLKPGAPATYTVQPGDTFVGIAEKYLDDPLQWRQLLAANPHIKNPYALYPGQVLNLEMINGQKKLMISDGGTVKLSPRVRSQAISHPIPVIPLSVIKPFLNNTRVVSQNDLKYSPYVVAAADNHLTTGAGDRVYVLNIAPHNPTKDYAIYRQGKIYQNPHSKQVLGYEALYIGKGKVVAEGQPATVLITQADREVQTKDRLLCINNTVLDTNYTLSKPDQHVDGNIISVIDGMTQVSQYQVVVIDLGHAQGLIPGNVLAIYQKGKKIENPIKPLVGYDARIQLPNQWAGDMMVFNVFDYVSYAVVLHATNVISVGDIVTNPQSI